MKKISVAIVASLFAFSASFAMQGQHERRQEQKSMAERAKVEEIIKNPKAYLGQKVQIDGKIEDVVVNGQSFILEGDTLWGNDILVVSKGRILNLDDMADEEKRVNIVGTVKYANFYELENDLQSPINPEMELDKEKGVTYILLENFGTEARLSE